MRASSRGEGSPAITRTMTWAASSPKAMASPQKRSPQKAKAQLLQLPLLNRLKAAKRLLLLLLLKQLLARVPQQKRRRQRPLPHPKQQLRRRPNRLLVRLQLLLPLLAAQRRRSPPNGRVRACVRIFPLDRVSSLRHDCALLDALPSRCKRTYSLHCAIAHGVLLAAAEEAILEYLNASNRPYSAQNVFDNLHGAIAKAMVSGAFRVCSKCLAKLPKQRLTANQHCSCPTLHYLRRFPAC